MAVTFPTQIFDPPKATPSPIGLYQHVDWTDELPRFLITDGVKVRTRNFGGEVVKWEAAVLCQDGDEIDEADYKVQDRPDISSLLKHTHETVWTEDHNYCQDLTEESRSEVRDRAAWNMTLREQIAAERQLATSLLANDGTPESAASFKIAVGKLEAAMAETGTLGFFHASPYWASQEWGLVIEDGARFKSPLGHTWVFGGGYVQGLGTTIVATSQIFGWRSDVEQYEDVDPRKNRITAVAERSVLFAYEKIIESVTIS